MRLSKKLHIASLALGLVGGGLLWWATDWIVTMAVTIILWGNNLGNSAGVQQVEEALRDMEDAQ